MEQEPIPPTRSLWKRRIWPVLRETFGPIRHANNIITAIPTVFAVLAIAGPVIGLSLSEARLEKYSHSHLDRAWLFGIAPAVLALLFARSAFVFHKRSIRDFPSCAIEVGRFSFVHHTETGEETTRMRTKAIFASIRITNRETAKTMQLELSLSLVMSWRAKMRQRRFYIFRTTKTVPDLVTKLSRTTKSTNRVYEKELLPPTITIEPEGFADGCVSFDHWYSLDSDDDFTLDRDVWLMPRERSRLQMTAYDRVSDQTAIWEVPGTWSS